MRSGSFKLHFAENGESSVAVTLESDTRFTGPIRLQERELDQLTDLISAMFDVLFEAQRRESER